MKQVLRKILSQRIINNYYHLPQAVLANIIYGFPAKELTVIGVTGTDGKSTTTNMIYQLLKAAGKKVSMVSTINAVIAGKVYDTGFHVTSPDPFPLQRLIRRAKGNSDEYLVLEVTSHALDQYRFWGIKFDVGIITNVTHEHLDYHKTYENYLNTKLKLIMDTKFAIVNEGIKVASGVGGKIITFGFNKGDFNQKEVKLKLKIPGEYNIENALASLAAAFALGINRQVAQKAVENFPGIAGRMEAVKNHKGIRIIIDFAHTPNALEQALKTLRASRGPKDQQTWSGRLNGRLIAVFGSAGKRDIGKRALMGSIAVKLADMVMVTAEDPRGELEMINRQIVNGAKKAGGVLGKNLFVVDDRQEAIDFAINKLAKKGDTVGIFGKGHETSMNLDGRKEIPWLDKKAVEKALKDREPIMRLP